MSELLNAAKHSERVVVKAPQVVDVYAHGSMPGADIRCVVVFPVEVGRRGHFHYQMKDFTLLSAGPRSALPDVSFRLQGSSSGKYRSIEGASPWVISVFPCAGRTVNTSPTSSVLW